MAVLAADVNCHSVGATTILPFSANAADTYYRGSIVWIDTGGGAQVGGMAAGDRILGISPKKQVIAAAADEVEVLVVGCVWMPVGTNVAAADEGELMVEDVSVILSDNPADMYAGGDLTLAANDAAGGVILRVTSTEMLVLFGSFTGRIYDATAAAWV